MPSHSPARLPAPSYPRFPALPTPLPTSHAEDYRLAHLFSIITSDNMPDTFRALHPHRTVYTYIHSTAASRIDRIHTTSALDPYIHSCNVISSATVSDHRPIALCLLARSTDPTRQGKGRRRTHLLYLKHPSLCADMQEWLSSRPIPPNDTGLILWWPAFKDALTSKIAALNRTAKTLDTTLSDSIQAAQNTLVSALSRLDEDETEALPAAIDARRTLTTLLVSHHRDVDTHRRKEWIHLRERPSPLITKLTRPPKDSSFIAVLRTPGGALETDATRMAEGMIKFWANISTLPPPTATTTAAQDRILDAIRAQPSCHIPSTLTTALGDAEVTEAEVKHALKSSAPGKAPGPDGLPVALFKSYPDFFIPLLSKLYTAIGRAHSTPHHFLAGLIASFHKKGDKTLPANYRPITLLGYDYRILAKILAARLLRCLSPTISPEQTAFLRGRKIGDSICLLQFLPHLLHRLDKSAAVVFCDFAKAYDTID